MPKVRALCSAGITRPRRSYDPVRLPPWPLPSATLRTLPSPLTGLPRLPEPPFRRAVPTTPADRAGARVDCFPARAAFPKWQEGRHPHCHFRGLHRLHSVTARRIAQPPKVTFVTRLRAQPVTRPSRSSASGPIDNYPGGILLHRCFAPSGRTATSGLMHRNKRSLLDHDYLVASAANSLRVLQTHDVGDDVVSGAGLKNQVRHVRMRTLEPNRECHPGHPRSVGDLFERGNGR